MKEILTWGAEVPTQFARLNIAPVLAYRGSGIVPSVYEFTNEQFAVLDADPGENWEGRDSGWRYAKGSNLSSDIRRVRINHHYLYGFVKWGKSCGPYDTLLEYICDSIGASQPRNVAAVTADLANLNGLSLGKLFLRYQPTPWAV